MTAGYVPIANYAEVGAVKPDGATIDVAPDGTLSVDASVTNAPPHLELTDGITDIGRVSKITVAHMVVGGAPENATLAPVFATEVNPGIMEPDGATLYVDQDGIVSALLATDSTPGIVQPDLVTIKLAPDGLISVPTASTEGLGLVQPDGTTITIDRFGVESAVQQGIDVADIMHDVADAVKVTFAHASISGSAADVTVTPDTAAVGTLGIAEPDGATIAATAGVLSAQLATAVTPGIMQPDNTTTTVDGAGVVSVPVMTDSTIGVGRPDGTTIIASAPGVLTVPIGTTSEPGILQPDGTTIHVTGGGVISAAPGGVAVAGDSGSVSGATSIDFVDAVVSGSTPNATVTPKQTSATQFGVAKVDGTTITAAAGIISATATGLPAGTQGDLLHHGASVWGSLAVGSSGQVPTSTGTDVVYAPQRTAIAANGTVAGTRHELDVVGGSSDVSVTATDDAGADTVHVTIDLADAIKTTIAALGTTTRFVSTAGTGKVFNVGTSGSPPANWQTQGFNDSSWAASVLQTSSTWTAIAGSDWITYQAGTVPSDDIWLFRFGFTLPVGTVTSWDWSGKADQHLAAVYLNGTLIFADAGTTDVAPNPPPTYVAPSNAIPVADGTTTNVLAIMVRTAHRTSPAVDTSLDYVMFFNTNGTGGGQGIEVAKNGTLVGTEPEINFIPGANVTIDVVDNPSNQRVDVTIAAAGGTSNFGQSGTVSITIPAGAATNTAAVTFSPAFTTAPVVVVASDNGDVIASYESVTATGFTARITSNVEVAPGSSITAIVSWSVGSGDSSQKLVASTTVTGTPSTLDFSSLPAGFSHFMIVAQLAGSTEAQVSMQFNADTAAHYDWQKPYENNSGLGINHSYGDTGINIGHDGVSGAYSSYTIMVPAYSQTTLNKTAHWHGGFLDVANSSIYQVSGFGQWRSAAAINEIKLVRSAGNFVAGTTVSIYGLI